MNRIKIKYNNKCISSYENRKSHTHFESKCIISNNSVYSKKSSKLKQFKSFERIICCKHRVKKVRFAEPIVTDVRNFPRLEKSLKIALFYSGDDMLRFIEDYHSSTSHSKMGNENFANKTYNFFSSQYRMKEDIVFDFIDDVISDFSVRFSSYIEFDVKSIEEDKSNKLILKDYDDYDLCQMIYLY